MSKGYKKILMMTIDRESQYHHMFLHPKMIQGHLRFSVKLISATSILVFLQFNHFFFYNRHEDAGSIWGGGTIRSAPLSLREMTRPSQPFLSPGQYYDEQDAAREAREAHTQDLAREQAYLTSVPSHTIPTVERAFEAGESGRRSS